MSAGARGLDLPAVPQSAPQPLSAGRLVTRTPATMDRRWVRPTVPSSGRPFPPPGPLGRVPRLHGYYERLRFPTVPPGPLRCLRRPVPRGAMRLRLARLSAPADRRVSGPSHRTRRTGQGLLSRSPSLRLFFAVEAVGPPRFLGNPPADVPHSPTPAGPTTPGPSQRVGAAFTENHPLGSRDCKPFGALSRGPSTHCLRFALAGCPATTQDSLPVGGLLCRMGFATHRVPLQGFSVCSRPYIHHLLAQASPGARFIALRPTARCGMLRTPPRRIGLRWEPTRAPWRRHTARAAPLGVSPVFRLPLASCGKSPCRGTVFPFVVSLRAEARYTFRRRAGLFSS